MKIFRKNGKMGAFQRGIGAYVLAMVNQPQDSTQCCALVSLLEGTINHPAPIVRLYTSYDVELFRRSTFILQHKTPSLARARRHTMTEGAPKNTPDEAEAPAAPAASASQSRSSSAGSNVSASSHGYPSHGGQAQPALAAPAAAHPQNVVEAQAQVAGVVYHPTFPDPAAAPNAAAGSGGDGTQTSSQSQAQKGDKPAAPSVGAGGTSSNNSGSRSTTPSKQTSTAAAASGAGSVAAASSSANTGTAASLRADKERLLHQPPSRGSTSPLRNRTIPMPLPAA